MRLTGVALALATLTVLGACQKADTDPTDVVDDDPLDTDTDTVEPSDTDVQDTDEPTDTDTPDDTDVPTDTSDTAVGPCAYPAGAVEPMAIDEVLSPYSWPEAIHRDGRRLDIDLAEVHCASDPDIDWSPHDVLVFVSIPAW